MLPESLTDAILKRGDTNVCRAIARNFGAQLSERGFSTLVATANRDDDIADSLVLRSDLPISMLHELLAVTTSAVRSRLHNIAPMEIRETIKASIEVIAAEECRKRPPPVDYTEAQSIVVELNKSGKLNDSTINHFAVHGKRTNLVSALSLLATVSVESIEALMAESDGYGLMVACRASRLDWQTALAVAGNRSNARRFNQRELEQIKDAYQALPLSVAQRLIRFESIRDFASAMRPHSAGSFPAKAGAR